MTKRENHYEAAFECFLRERGVPYVAVDETRRSLIGDRSLKSLDFVVSPPQRPESWLIDVKGRRFPSGRRRQYWKNWSTADDLRSLAAWERLFGIRFRGLLVFAYCLAGDRSPVEAERLFAHRDRLYAFLGVRLDHYTSWARPISPKWQTLAVPAALFRQLAVPLDRLLSGAPASAAAPS